MSGRRFELVLDGETSFCVAYASEAEREAALAYAVAPGISHPAPSDGGDRSRPRGPGRPATQRALLEQAAEALGSDLDPTLPLARRRRRRLIEQYLVRAGAETLPARSTTEEFLTSRLVAENSAEKSPEKSAKRSIAGTGG